MFEDNTIRQSAAKESNTNTSQPLAGTDSSQPLAGTDKSRPLAGRLLYLWSFVVLAMLLLFFGAPSVVVSWAAGRRYWVYPWARWGARTWLRLSGAKVNVRGREHLDPHRTYVFISNHRSYLDTALLFAHTGRRMGIIAKQEMLRIPVLGYGMGYVNVMVIDRAKRSRAVETMREATNRIRSGISFGVFAEGTRARPGELLPFKTGAVRMAIEAGVDIVPVAIKNTDKLMSKNSGVAWPGTIEMVMLPPISTANLAEGESARSLTEIVRGRIAAELQRNVIRS